MVKKVIRRLDEEVMEVRVNIRKLIISLSLEQNLSSVFCLSFSLLIVKIKYSRMNECLPFSC